MCLSGLLRCVGSCHAHGQCADATYDANTLGDADGAARIKNVEQVRTLQGQFVGGQNWISFLVYRSDAFVGEKALRPDEQTFGLGLVQIEVLPELRNVGFFKVIDRKLQLFGQPHLAISDGRASLRITRPHDIVDRVHILQKRGDALHAVGKLGTHGIEIKSAALLEVGELRDLQPVEHDLPAYAPRTASGPLPVVFFELEVVLLQIDAHGLERFEIELLHVDRRWFEDQLKLCVLEEAIRILSVAAIGGPSGGLGIADFVRFWSEHAEKCFRSHGASSDLDIVGLLQNAATLGPEALEAEEQFLKRKGGCLWRRCDGTRRHRQTLFCGTSNHLTSQCAQFGPSHRDCSEADQDLGSAQSTLQMALERLQGEPAQVVSSAAAPRLGSKRAHRGPEHAESELPRVGAEFAGVAIAMKDAEQAIGVRVETGFGGPQGFAASRAVCDVGQKTREAGHPELKVGEGHPGLLDGSLLENRDEKTEDGLVWIVLGQSLVEQFGKEAENGEPDLVDRS